jgi:hypothetical protein
MVEPEDESKAQAGGSSDGKAGRSAGGDGRRSVERRNWKVIRRRKLLADGKVGPEGCLKAQAGEQQDGWLLYLTPISVGG